MRLIPPTYVTRADFQALVASTVLTGHLSVRKRTHQKDVDRTSPPFNIPSETKINRPRKTKILTAREIEPEFNQSRSWNEFQNIFQKIPVGVRDRNSDFIPHLRFMMDNYSSDSIEPLSESGVAALADDVARLLTNDNSLPDYEALIELHDILIGAHPSTERISALRLVNPRLLPALLSVSRITTRPCSYSFNIPTLAAYLETPRTPIESADMLSRSRSCLLIKLADCLENSWRTTAMWEVLDAELYLGSRPASRDLTRTLQSHLFNLCNLNYTCMDSPLRRVQLIVVWDYILGLPEGTPFKESPLSWTALVSHLSDLVHSRSLLSRLKVEISARERTSLAVEWGRELQKHSELTNDLQLWDVTKEVLLTSTDVSEPQATSYMVQRGLLGHFTPRQWQVPDDMMACSARDSFQCVLGMPFCKLTCTAGALAAKESIQKLEEEAFASDFIAAQGLFSPKQRATIALQHAETSPHRRWPSLTGYPGAKLALCAPGGRPHWRVELDFVLDLLLSLQQHKLARVRLPVLEIVLWSAENVAVRVSPKPPCTEAIYVALQSLPTPDAGDKLLLDTLDCLAKEAYLPTALDFLLHAPDEVNGALTEIIKTVSTVLTSMFAPTISIERCLKACLNSKPPIQSATLGQTMVHEDPGPDNGAGEAAHVGSFSETPYTDEEPGETSPTKTSPTQTSILYTKEAADDEWSGDVG
ncbi:MAG: uncharacterized protein KVP18_001032, partial [Porospora cf. gigantea A]